MVYDKNKFLDGFITSIAARSAIATPPDIPLLIDFEYTENADGTYTLTEWKGTYKGVESTRCVVPDNPLIIIDFGGD